MSGRVLSIMQCRFLLPRGVHHRHTVLQMTRTGPPLPIMIDLSLSGARPHWPALTYFTQFSERQSFLVSAHSRTLSQSPPPRTPATIKLHRADVGLKKHLKSRRRGPAPHSDMGCQAVRLPPKPGLDIFENGRRLICASCDQPQPVPLELSQAHSTDLLWA